MNREYCEKVRISAMAILDGEVPLLSENQVNEHLASCADCCRELEQQKQAARLLDGQSRRVFAEDLWPRMAVAIEKLTAKPKHLRELHFFVMLSLFLLGYKIVEVLPGISIGVLFKLLPLGVVFVFFGLLKQNPIEISQSLRLEGDTE